MKFARLLRATAFEGMPQMQTLFSAYKALKKKIKKLPYKEQLVQSQGGSADSLTDEEAEFVQALSDTLNQLNDIYIEKEETSVIRVERLESDLATATTPEQLNELHKQFVDFHGEVLLLVHWSILAYTATVKILKKHHKRTGLLVKAPQLGNLLSQPFCSTELMTSIARRVEEDILRLAERMGVPMQRASEPSHQLLLQPAGPQVSSEPLGTPSTNEAAMAAAAAAMAAAAAACSDNAAAGPSAAAAAAAAAAMAAAAGMSAGAEAALSPGVRLGQELPDRGLDLQLLRQLAAESGSGTSRSDDSSAEKDTCASRQQQPCSQQAHLHHPMGADDANDDVLEVQSAPKRRRATTAATAPESCAQQPAEQQQPSAQPVDVVMAEVDPTAAAAVGEIHAQTAAKPAAMAGSQAGANEPSAQHEARAGPAENETVQTEQQVLEQQRNAIMPHAVSAGHGGTLLGHLCPAAVEHRGSTSGALPAEGAEEQLQQQQQQHPQQQQDQADEHAMDSADGADVPAAGPQQEQEQQLDGMGCSSGDEDADADAAVGSCARQASIMRQTQVALTTWRHLQSTASTPSTVMQGGLQQYHRSDTALTASSAVQ